MHPRSFMNIRHTITKKILRWVLVLCFAGFVPCPSLAAVKPPAPCGAVPTERQVNWLRMEWYAFVHFGINTFTGKEWGYGDEKPELFNPSGFDPESAAKVFKKAGMAGMIYTAKHHDGFCLWPTGSTTHNITRSPWKKGKGGYQIRHLPFSMGSQQCRVWTPGLLKSLRAADPRNPDELRPDF